MPDGSLYTVRPATAADASAIGYLMAERREEMHKVGHYTAFVERLLDRIARNPERSVLLVAERRGAIIGHARAGYFEPPEGSPPDVAPAGWYLLGVAVHPAMRRKGVGTALTEARMAWLAERAREVWYFRDMDNVASAVLHAPSGFEPITTAFSFPGTRDPSAPMVLLRAVLRR